MATAMPNNVGSGSQRASGSGSGIEPDEGKSAEDENTIEVMHDL